MPTYIYERTDHYLIEVEAKDRREARKKLNAVGGEQYLNGGDFLESTFAFVEVKENE